MTEKSKITSKGQLTMPVAIRRALGVKEGDMVVFEVSKEGQVRVRPEKKQGRFAKYKGAGLGDIKTKAQMDAWLKDLRGRDE
jgi:AbrB family looped-hinge helix DNA binding protein